MAFQINKLIRHIDELLIWLRDNPDTPIPIREKERLKTIVNQLSFRKEISDKEWEKIKPKKEIDPDAIDYKFWKDIKVTLAELKKNNAKEIAKYKPTSKRQKGAVPLPLKPYSSIKEKDDDINVTKNGRTMKLCPGCCSPILPKNLAKHKKKCKAFNQKNKAKVPKKEKASQKPSSKLFDNKHQDLKKERKLDGSSGYHTLRREQGRFGSHSSYDNMDDNSSP